MRLRRIAALLLVLAAAAAPAAEDDGGDAKGLRESAARLHQDGRRLLKAGKLEDAARAFREAVEEAPEHVAPRWALARTLARLRARGRICDVGATEREILDHLEVAVRHDADRVERLRRDAAFDVVRGAFRFQRLLGLDPADEEDLRVLLVKPAWHGPPGAYHLPVATIDFREDGTAVLRERDQARGANEKGPAEERESRGAWRIEAGAAVVTFADRELRFLLGGDGVLTAGDLRFTDAREECGH